MLKNAMNYLGEIAAGGLGHGNNGDEADHSPTSNDHIVGSVVDVGGIQVCSACISHTARLLQRDF